jgi:integrase/recombinase XerD
MKKTTNFYDYLIEKHFSLTSAKAYRNTMRSFENWAIENEITPQETTYNELLEYINYSRNKGNSAHTINLKNAILKHYFDYHKRTKNPADELYLRGVTRLLPKNALSKEELENIYHKYNDYDLVRKRNKIILGLAIFQGVSSSELERLMLEDIQLEKGIVYIKSGHQTNSRNIELKAFQLLSIQNYIIKIRPLILQKKNKETDQFFITIGTGKKLNSVISNTLKTIKKIEPKIISFQHIRTSVITHWIKENGLRKTQYLAGHRYVSSTERYEVSYLEDLKKNIDSFHPF